MSPVGPDTPDAVRADLAALILLHGAAPVRATVAQIATTPTEDGDLPHGGANSEPDTLDVLVAPHGGAPRGFKISTPSGPATRGDISTVEPDTAPAARALHLRRALEAAADHAAAMLPALGLPRLVADGFEPIDVAAAGDALEAAVAALDALDGDPDVEDGGDDEPSLGWPSHLAQGTVNVGGTDDVELVDEDRDDLDYGEHDPSDDEASLGWPEDAGAVMSAEVCFLTADPEAEGDDADLEHEEGVEALWVFGAGRREAVLIAGETP